MTAATESMFSATVRPSASVSASSAVTSPVPVFAACATMSAASCWNCSFLATKSVSQFSWIMAPSAAATSPLVALRSAPRSLTLVSPLMRSSSAALSWSPADSSSALLAAIIPAPVASRSCLTSAAVMFAMTSRVSLSCPWWSGRSRPAGPARRGRPGGRDSGLGGALGVGGRGLGRRGRLGGRCLSRRCLSGRCLSRRCLSRRCLSRRCLRRGLALQDLLLPGGQRLVGGKLGRLLVAVDLGADPGHQALGHGVRDHPGEQGDGADRVVVSRDLVVDLVRVAVGVQDRDDRDVELPGLADRDVLLLGVHDPDSA